MSARFLPWSYKNTDLWPVFTNAGIYLCICLCVSLLCRILLCFFLAERVLLHGLQHIHTVSSYQDRLWNVWTELKCLNFGSLEFKPGFKTLLVVGTSVTLLCKQVDWVDLLCRWWKWSEPECWCWSVAAGPAEIRWWRQWSVWGGVDGVGLWATQEDITWQ